MTDLPTFLYRYRSLTGYAREDVERILAHGQIRFSSPAWFNDPFDCKLAPTFDATEDEKRCWLEDSYVPTVYPGLSNTDRAKAVEELMPEGNDLLRKHIEYTMQELIPNSGVISLSAVPDHILMWSHYANGHRGICLKFRRFTLRFGQDFEEFEKQAPPPYQAEDGFSRRYEFEAQPVDYSDDVPKRRPLAELHNAWRASVFTKSTHWRYEGEWRVLLPPGGNVPAYGWHQLPADSLAGLILGCEISAEDEKLVREWVRMGGVRLPFLRAEKKQGRFEVEIREIG